RKPPSSMKLAYRLFGPERAGPVRNLRSKIPLLESYHPNLSFFQRFIAILLAAVCVCVGIAIIVPAVQNEKWLIELLGPVLCLLGLLWRGWGAGWCVGGEQGGASV